MPRIFPLLLAFALVSSPSLAEDMPKICMNAEQFRDRVLAPLHRLERCTAEIEIQGQEKDELAQAVAVLALEARALEARALEGERKLRRSRRAKPIWAGAGAILVLTLIILL
jgi:hypothetical protein